jgi:hypothetical protein
MLNPYKKLVRVLNGHRHPKGETFPRPFRHTHHSRTGDGPFGFWAVRSIVTSSSAIKQSV